MSRLPLELHWIVLSMLTPYDLYIARNVCRSWKSTCEELIIKEVSQLMHDSPLGREDEQEDDGKLNGDTEEKDKNSRNGNTAGFQYILQNYSFLLKLPFVTVPGGVYDNISSTTTSSTPIATTNSTSENAFPENNDNRPDNGVPETSSDSIGDTTSLYNDPPSHFEIELSESGVMILKLHDNTYIRSEPACSRISWCPLDGEPTLETAKRVAIARVIELDYEEPFSTHQGYAFKRGLDILSISILERGSLKEGLDILKNWSILYQVELRLPFHRGEGRDRFPAFTPITCGLHTFQFSVEINSDNYCHVLGDVSLRSVLLVRDLHSLIQPYLYEQYAFLVWRIDNDCYAIGNPLLIPNFGHSDDDYGYWLVSYWRHIIENALMWTADQYIGPIHPIDTGKTFLLDEKAAIVEFDNIPTLSFETYYSQRAGYRLFPSASFLSSRSRIIQIPPLPLWRTLTKVRFYTIVRALPTQMRSMYTSLGHIYLNGSLHVCYLYSDGSYVPGFRHVIVDLSKSALQSIISARCYTLYHLNYQFFHSVYADACCILLCLFYQDSQSGQFLYAKAIQSTSPQPIG